MQSILQKKSLIFSIVFLLFSCFLVVFLYLTINNNKELAKLAQEKWQTEDLNTENTKSLINLVKTTGPERELLETHFIKDSDVVPFLDMVERLARETSVDAEIVSVGVSKDTSSLLVETKVSGSFETIYKFILLLENSQYELEFTSVNIMTSNTESLSTDKIPKWTANIGIKLLSFINK